MNLNIRGRVGKWRFLTENPPGAFILMAGDLCVSPTRLYAPRGRLFSSKKSKDLASFE